MKEILFAYIKCVGNMKEYVGNMKKYVENMKKYVKNMKEIWKGFLYPPINPVSAT